MDKRLLFPNFLDSDYKLIRASSFSELSTTKFNIEQKYQSEKHGNLIKQYSCEQIFDKSHTSHLKVSRVLKSDNEEYTDIWTTTVPTHDSLKHKNMSKESNKLLYLQEKFSMPNQYLTFATSENINTKNILAPPKLIIQENKLKMNINDQNNLVDNEQLSSSNRIFNKNFKIKKTTLLSDENFNNTMYQYSSTENKKVDDQFRDKKCLFENSKINNTDEKNEIKVDTIELKKKCRSLIVTPRQEKKNNTNLCWLFIFLILFPVAIASLVMFLNNKSNLSEICNPRFIFDKIPQELKNRIYGQDVAINDLNKYFVKRNNKTSFDIIILIGETGVGKSYVTEIIKANTKDNYNILEYFSPLYATKENQVSPSLSVCKCNLIKLENLKTDDILDAVKFISELKKQFNSYCILILVIFNTHEVNSNLKQTLNLNKSISIIDKKFNEADLKPTIITFTRLREDALIKCIKDVADYINVNLSNEDIDYVLHTLLKADSGCKGAYAKVQLFKKNKK